MLPSCYEAADKLQANRAKLPLKIASTFMPTHSLPLQSQHNSMKTLSPTKPPHSIKMHRICGTSDTNTCDRPANEVTELNESLLCFSQCLIEFTFLHIRVIGWRPRLSHDYESGSSSKNYILGLRRGCVLLRRGGNKKIKKRYLRTLWPFIRSYKSSKRLLPPSLLRRASLLALVPLVHAFYSISINLNLWGHQRRAPLKP